MRAKQSSGPLTVQAIAGSHVVTFGIDHDSDPAALAGLLGFGIERLDHTDGEHRWLPNRIRFPGVTNPGTHWNPLQSFLWGDYTAKPGHDYTYRVHALDGTPGQRLNSRASVVLRLSTHLPEEHGVWFNRGVVASQAYHDRFDNAHPKDVPNREAWRWLSRGLEEAIIGFIGQADSDEWELHGALYEFRFDSVINAFDVARDAGAAVELVVDDDPKNRAAATAVDDLVVCWRARAQIPHNKFIVAVHNGVPKSVWTGSTNITENGIFGQLNVGHRIDDPAIAQTYLGYWHELTADPTPGTLNNWVDQNSPVPSSSDDWSVGTTVVFSPHTHADALDRYAELFSTANQLLCMTLPFKLDNRFTNQLTGNHAALRWLLFEDRAKADAARVGVTDPDTELVAGAVLVAGGFRDWAEELDNPLTSNIDFIHTKFLLIDPLGPDPIVVTGSANFSEASTTKNDENMLVVRGESDVADLYLTEFMRIFEHYRFRQRINVTPAAPVPTAAAAEAAGHTLEEDAWYEKYYNEPARAKKRQVLAGTG